MAFIFVRISCCLLLLFCVASLSSCTTIDFKSSLFAVAESKGTLSDFAAALSPIILSTSVAGILTLFARGATFLNDQHQWKVVGACASGAAGLAYAYIWPNTMVMRCFTLLNTVLVILDYARLHDSLQAGSPYRYFGIMFTSASVALSGVLYALSPPRHRQDIMIGTYIIVSSVVPFPYFQQGELCKGMLLLVALLISGLVVLPQPSIWLGENLAAMPDSVQDHSFCISVVLHGVFSLFSLYFVFDGEQHMAQVRAWTNGQLRKHFPERIQRI